MGGYAGYNGVTDPHNSDPIAEEGLTQIAPLYRVEAQSRGQSTEGRLAIRQQKAIS